MPDSLFKQFKQGKFAHLEHVGSKDLNIVLPELSEDHFAELREEYHPIPKTSTHSMMMTIRIMMKMMMMILKMRMTVQNSGKNITPSLKTSLQG